MPTLCLESAAPTGVKYPQAIVRVVKYRITIYQDEDGVYIAECPALPGTVAQGKTRKEALANVTDAIEGYIASLKKHDEPVPRLCVGHQLVEVLRTPRAPPPDDGHGPSA
ncbi:MAG: type II toxin-antitoxin system HicB family antitoxin [Nitrososphaerota archaeon]|nr:type II toxin-antitoxin system HicB family antitoxin [Nitrososphaerota archaeon]